MTSGSSLLSSTHPTSLKKALPLPMPQAACAIRVTHLGTPSSHPCLNLSDPLHRHCSHCGPSRAPALTNIYGETARSIKTSLYRNRIVIWHSLRLNAEVLARTWQILGSLVVEFIIILQVVINFFMCLVRNLPKNGKNFQNQSSCGSALGTALTDWRSDMCNFSTDLWRLS